MNRELQQHLENLPAGEPRSRLEPYRELILRWRRQRRTYRWIQRVLAEECRVSVSHVALIKFVKFRMRARKPQPEAELVTEAPTARTRPLQPKAQQAASNLAIKQALMDKSRAKAAEEKRLFDFGWDRESTLDTRSKQK